MADAADFVTELLDDWSTRHFSTPRTAVVGLLHCEGCDEEIPARRREAHPQARRCVQCQEKSERTRT